LNITPAFRVVANSQDITDKIMSRFKSLRITDETDNTSDTLELQLADHDPSDPIQLPPAGAELEAFIGYDGEVRRVGLYICDEVEISGYPGSMTLRARAAPFETSKGGKNDLQTEDAHLEEGHHDRRHGAAHGRRARAERSRERIAGVDRAAADGAVAGVGHEPAAAPGQTARCHRQARRRPPDVRQAGRIHQCQRRAHSRCHPHPRRWQRYRVTSPHAKTGTTIAYYRDVRSAKRQEVKVGSGEPIMRLRMAYADRESAEAAARAKHREQARQTRTLSYTLPGRETLMAEATVVMQGFREGVDGQWLVKRAEHSIGSEGYVTSIECEQPNSADAVKAASNASASEGEQVGSEV
jgi:hypothetical protein